MLDLATEACFFALREIKLLPGNTHCQKVHCRSSELPAQSAFEKHVRDKFEDLLKKNPMIESPFNIP